MVGTPDEFKTYEEVEECNHIDFIGMKRAKEDVFEPILAYLT